MDLSDPAMRMEVNVKDWELKAKSIRDSVCSDLVQAAYESLTTPEIVNSISYLRTAQADDASWDMDGMLTTPARDFILKRLACTTYSAVLIARTEGKINDVTEQALRWVLKNYKALLSGHNVRYLGICAYYMCRAHQTGVLPEQEVLDAAGEMADRLAELQQEGGGWVEIIGTDEDIRPTPHVTATVRRALFAFDRNRYADAIDISESFLNGWTEWHSLLEIADVCGMLIETHAGRSNRLVQELLQIIVSSQEPSGRFQSKEYRDPDVLTAAVAIRSLIMNDLNKYNESIMRGLEHLAQTRLASQGGWPTDTSRYLPDPWTTTEVLHTNLHIARVAPLSVAFNLILRFHERVHDEVMLGIEYDLTHAHDKLTKLSQKYADLEKQLAEQISLRNSDKEELAILKGSTSRYEKLVADREEYIQRLNVMIDGMRSERIRDLEANREFSIAQEQRVRDAFVKSGQADLLQSQLVEAQRTAKTLRWIVGLLLTLSLAIAGYVVQLLSTIAGRGP